MLKGDIAVLCQVAFKVENFKVFRNAASTQFRARNSGCKNPSCRVTITALKLVNVHDCWYRNSQDMDNNLIKDVAKQMRPDIRSGLSRALFRVFVFGPCCTPDEVVPKPTCLADTQDNVVAHAKYIRHLIKEKLAEAGFKVDYGETESIFKAWCKGFPEGDPLSFEMDHAEFFCKAIIIIPASIGAICELSVFATQPHLAIKSLAIIHEKYSQEKSFFNAGVVRVLKQDKGSAQYIDYLQHQKCIDAAVSFVEDEWSSFNRKHRTYVHSQKWGEENGHLFEQR